MKIKELENSPYWLRRAIVQDEDVEIVDGGVVWKGGTWKGGVWKGGTWKGGTWKGGVWEDGVWEHGVWEHGVWEGGYIKSLAPPKVLEILMNASQALQARNKELEPLAKCALELRKWFLDNEFWNDENSEDIFPILEKHGLVECVVIHNCDNNEPGDTIWYFPPLAGESV